MRTHSPSEVHLAEPTTGDFPAAEAIAARPSNPVAAQAVRGPYYNLMNKAGHYKVETPDESMIWDIPAELICAKSITISGVEYELQNGFFFITQEPVEWFRIGDKWYDVIE